MGSLKVPLSGPAVRNALHLGSSFCLQFLAFSVAQNFQTSSDHKAAGAASLAVLYASGCAATFVAPFIVNALGNRMSLFCGACTYVAFVAANIHYVKALLFASSATLGFGASVLWTAQGAYISNCAALHEQAHALPHHSTLGFFNGLFFSIFQVNQLAGNLLAAALFAADVGQQTIFIIMTAICAFGVLTLLLLRDPAKALSNTGAALVSSEDMSSSAVLESVAGDHSVATYVHSPVMDDGGGGASPEPLLIHREPNSNGLNSSDGDLAYADAKPRSRCARFFAIFEPLRLLYHPRMLVLIPLMSYSGLSQGYMYGDVPPLVDKKSTKFFVLAVIGGADALASMVMGKLSDKIGRVRTMAIGFACALSAIIFMWQWTVDQSATHVFFIMGVLLGVSDGVFNTQIYSLLGMWFPTSHEAAFACLKLCQAGSAAVAFGLDGVMGFEWKSCMTGSMLGAGATSLVLFDLYCRSKGARGSVLDGAQLHHTDEHARRSPDCASSPILHEPHARAVTTIVNGHVAANGDAGGGVYGTASSPDF